eukprot:TRINITY_DN6390_c0_g1_i2.p1 TRINITY_DN6390_c0_g1~~TRINITY_DN6390_c0_g1_i2.p1  ORF type:complete len:636 (+),score=109.27 TRINITY_DN6390_c0_g1_i2:25-1932(+)
MITLRGKDVGLSEFYAKFKNGRLKMKKKYMARISDLFFEEDEQLKLEVLSIFKWMCRDIHKYASHLSLTVPALLSHVFEFSSVPDMVLMTTVKLLKNYCRSNVILDSIIENKGVDIVLKAYTTVSDEGLEELFTHMLFAFGMQGMHIREKIDKVTSWTKIIQTPSTSIRKTQFYKSKTVKRYKSVSTDQFEIPKRESIQQRRKSKISLTRKISKTTILAKCCLGEETRLIHLPKDINLELLKELVEIEYYIKDFGLKFEYETDLVTMTKDEDLKLLLTQSRVKIIVTTKEPLKRKDSFKQRRTTPETNGKKRYSRTIAHSSMDVFIRKSRNRYEIPYYDLEFENIVLGEGYFSEVRKATWLGSTVACKLLFGRSFSQIPDHELFYREVEILNSLRHPRTILYLGTAIHPESKNLIIICEYMDNGSLHDVMRNREKMKQFTNGSLIRIGWDIALGMAYLHERNEPIFHRDLTSKNVLLDNMYRAKVADFGLSKMNYNSRPTSNTMGTIAWMAPEIILDPTLFSTKSDVYSFGVILWELYTEGDPHPADCTTFKLVFKITNEGYRPTLPACPEEWKGLINTCWKEEPNDRPEFKDLIQPLQDIYNSKESQKISWPAFRNRFSASIESDSLEDNGYNV